MDALGTGGIVALLWLHLQVKDIRIKKKIEFLQ